MYSALLRGRHSGRSHAIEVTYDKDKAGAELQGDCKLLLGKSGLDGRVQC